VYKLLGLHTSRCGSVLQCCCATDRESRAQQRADAADPMHLAHRQTHCIHQGPFWVRLTSVSGVQGKKASLLANQTSSLPPPKRMSPVNMHGWHDAESTVGAAV